MKRPPLRPSLIALLEMSLQKIARGNRAALPSPYWDSRAAFFRMCLYTHT